MKSIVPSPRGQVRTAAAASLPVLARIPDVSAPQRQPERSEPPQQPETDEVVTKKMDDRPPRAEKNDVPGGPTPEQAADRDRPRERTRQQRLPQAKSPRPAATRSPHGRRRPALPPTSYLLAGLLAVVLIVLVVLLTGNKDSAPDSQHSPNWPSADHDYANSGSQHGHEMTPGETGAMDMGSPLGQDPGEMAGMALPNQTPSNSAPPIGQTSDVTPPGVVQLNGTIDKPDLQAQRPRENGVYAPQ